MDRPTQRTTVAKFLGSQSDMNEYKYKRHGRGPSDLEVEVYEAVEMGVDPRLGSVRHGECGHRDMVVLWDGKRREEI